MSRVRDLLNRYRPAGAPGAASGTGVPVDRLADARVELAPVFAAIEAVGQECRAIREAAADAARAKVAAAQVRAQRLAADAERRAPVERADAANRAHADAAPLSAQLMNEAAEQAASCRHRASVRAPDLVEHAIMSVRSLIAADVDSEHRATSNRGGAA